MYDAVAQGDVDSVAGISTDDRIPALNPVVSKTIKASSRPISRFPSFGRHCSIKHRKSALS